MLSSPLSLGSILLCLVFRQYVFGYVPYRERTVECGFSWFFGRFGILCDFTDLRFGLTFVAILFFWLFEFLSGLAFGNYFRSTILS